MTKLRDANDWRAGDVIAEGPDWKGSFFGKCFHCGRPQTWEEYWTFESAGRWTPVVGRVYRNHGNVDRVVIGHGGGRGNFTITPNGKRYIINPACENGGYRDSNKPDKKYATDKQGRFLSHGKKTTTGT